MQFPVDRGSIRRYGMAMITSVKNERIKQARAVREGRGPGSLFIEGERLVDEVLAAGLEVEVAFGVGGELLRSSGRR